MLRVLVRLSLLVDKRDLDRDSRLAIRSALSETRLYPRNIRLRTMTTKLDQPREEYRNETVVRTWIARVLCVHF